MADWVPTLFIIGIVFLLIRWFAGDGTATSNSSSGQSIPGITPATVETLHSAFPDIPIPNLIYSLSRTRSAQRTSEEIIEKGYLAAPPASYSPPAALLPPSVNPPSLPSSPAQPNVGFLTIRTGQNKTTATRQHESLIDRYRLSGRLGGDSVSASASASASESGSESDVIVQSGAGTPSSGPNAKGAASAWADSKEAREKGLRERKEKMILEARRKMLERQKAAQQSASGISTPPSYIA